MIVGGDRFVAKRIGHPLTDFPALAAGSVFVTVAVDGRLAAYLVMSDALRPGARSMLNSLRREGIERILLATGDRRDVAERITEGLGLDGLRVNLSPDQKVLLALSERKNGPVMMVGDGVNDAPAFAAADVGVAMGARCSRLGGSRRCGAACGPHRPSIAGNRYRSEGAWDRCRECRGRHWSFHARNDGRGVRLSHTGMGRFASRSHRRCRHSECSTCSAHRTTGAVTLS